MNKQEFESTSIAILRTAVGWQTKIAKLLEVDARTVRRWVKDGCTPEWVDAKIAEILGEIEVETVWPRDEWCLGDGADGREYLIHMVQPRFIARVVECDDGGAPIPDELPADVTSGVVYDSGSYCLCELAWIDKPREGEVTALMEAACDFIETVGAMVACR